MKHRNAAAAAASLTNSGIHMQETPRISVQHPSFSRIVLSTALLTFLGIFGTAGTFLTIYPFFYDYARVGLCLLLSWGICTTIVLLPRKWFLLTGIPLLLLTEFCLIRNFHILKKSYLLLRAVMFYTQTDIGTLPEPHEISVQLTPLFIYGIFVLSMLICLFSVRFPNVVLGFLCTFPFAEIGLFYGYQPRLLCFGALLAYWMGLLAHSTAGSGFGLHHKRNQFYAKSQLRRIVGRQSTVLLTASALLLFFGAQLAISASDYRRSDKIDLLRNTLQEKANNFSIDDIGNFFSNLPGNFGIDVNNENRRTLGLDDEVQHSHKVMLQVNVTQPLSADVYLKSYVGTEYTGHGWDQLPNKAIRKNEAMFTLFQKRGLFPQDFLGIQAFFFNQTDGEPTYQNLTIYALHDEPANFIPYGSLGSGIYRYVADETLVAENKQDYSVTFCNLNYTNADTAMDAATRSAGIADCNDINLEAVYDAYQPFVENYDRALPDSPALDEVRKMFHISPDSDSSGTSAQKRELEIATQIRDQMHQMATYTLAPGKSPKNQDFVYHFLKNSKQGYCSYFATAGVVLCRMYGVPARYVEGYVVLREDCNENTGLTDGGFRIDIDDSRAHAWAEIYVDCLGWVPFEFTPGSASLFTPVGETAQTTTQTTAITTTGSTTSRSGQTTTRGSRQTTTLTTTTTTGSTSRHAGISDAARMKIRIVLAVLLVLVYIVLLICQHHAKVIRQRHKLLQSENANEAALAEYHYLLALLRQLRLKPENELPSVFAQTAEQCLSHLQHGQLQRAVAIAQEADLSTHMVSTEDRDYLHRLTTDLSEKLYRQSNPLVRLRLRYLLHLID